MEKIKELLAIFLLTISGARADPVDRNGLMTALLLESRIRQSGDIELGGLFSVHTSLVEGRAPFCDGHDFPSLLASQAMIYQVDKINMNQNILPNHTLGYEMMDDCLSVDLAVKAATMYLMGDTVRDRRQWMLDYRRKRMEMAKAPKWSPIRAKSPKVAIIGPTSSDLSTAIGSMTSVNLLPVISYATTSGELSQKKKYPSFLRTVPSDELQVSAMADLIRHFNWTWISAVGTDDTYGQFGVVGLKEELLSRNICLAKELVIDRRMSRESILSTLNELFNDTMTQRAQVIVLFCSGSLVGNFLQVVKERGITNKTWIATESWGYRELPIQLRDAVQGALGLVIDNPRPQHFMKYMNELTLGQLMQKNPWFYAYLLKKGIVNSSVDANRTLGDIGYHIDPMWYSSVTPVMDAVKAVALSLDRLIRDKNMTVDAIYPIDLLRALRSGTYPNSVDPSVQFKFNQNGDVVGGYTITNLRTGRDYNGDEVLRFETVGQWISDQCGEQCSCAGGLTRQPISNSSRGQLCLDEAEMVWPSGSDEPPESSCQKECPAGTYKIYGGSRCCWTCNTCPTNTYSNGSGSSCCRPCHRTMINNPDHTGCTYKSDYAEWKSVGEMVALVVAGVGLIVDTIVASVLFSYRRTPVVVCSNAPLTFILLYLLATAFTLPPLYVLRPSTGLCFAESALFGWTFSTITAIFFTKTYHVLQIFTAKLSHTLHMLSQRGLQRREIWLSLGLGAAVLLPTIPYLIVNQPKPVDNESSDCGAHWVNAQLVNMAYIALLSLATTYVSFRARNLPENYNEAHTVATTMLMLMLVWVSSVPSYYRVSMANRALILGLAVEAAAFCILVLVFGPKLYLIFIEPHKNTPLYVSRMNMIHLWKQQSKKRLGSTSSRRTVDSGDTLSVSGASPVRKRLRMEADKVLAKARRGFRSQSVTR